MKSFTIQKSDIGIECRFEASFYLYSVVIRQKCLERNISFDQLGNMCECISDGEHSAIPRTKVAGVRYLYGRNIKDGIVDFDPETDSSYISEANYKRFTRTYVKEGDLLITIVGTVGKVAVYAKSYIGEAGIPRHIAKIRLKPDSWATPEFLTAYFLSRLGKHQICNITTGNIQPLLSLCNIKTLDIPRIEKQIVDIITTQMKKMVELEAEALRLINLAKQTFYERLGLNFDSIERPKTYTISSAEFKNAEIWNTTYSLPLYVNTQIAIKGICRTVSLGEVVRIDKGDEVGSENYNVYLEKHDTDIPFIRTSDIVNFEVDQYPDFYVPVEIYNEIGQDVKAGDVIFSKDGKIGQVSLITDFDKAIIASGFSILRLNNKAYEYGLTPEYLFTVLAIREIGIFESKRRTVVASTIPHLREDRMKEMQIPILDKTSIDEITNLVREAFILKAERKRLVADVRKTIDSYFDIECSSKN